MGRAIGDDVELGEGPQRRRYRIVSIERRLPASAAPAGSPPAKPGPGSAAPDSPP